MVSADEIVAVALHHCGEQNSCSGCVRLQDGHCFWDLDMAQCVGESNDVGSNSNFVQNIWNGRSPQCPEGDGDPDYYIGDGKFLLIV